MSYGFTATNNYNQILISSDTRNLHFIGKAYLYNALKSEDGYGGLRQWSFRIGTAKDIQPLPFFTMTGSEYYGITAIRQISVGQNIILTTGPVPITGQLEKTYTWNSTPVALTEGTNNIYSITTTNVRTGSTLYWDISPSTGNDFQYTDGSFIIDATGAGSFQISPTKFFDPYPEVAENYTVNVRTYTQLTGAVVLSKTFSVSNSTSTDITGFGWTTDANWGPSVISEGVNNTATTAPGAFVITATQGNNSVIVTSPAITLAAEYPETYTFATLALSMNEGTAYTVGITSSNVKDGTIVYWEIPSSTNEFLITSGSFTITSNAGSFSVTPTSFYDAFAEAAETYNIVLKRFNGTTYNTVKTSSAITVVNVANAAATTGLGWNTNATFGPTSLTEGVVGSGAPNSVTGTIPTNVYVVTDVNPGNAVYATSFPITIRSQYAETYSFTNAAVMVEGTTVAVTVTTTNVPNSTVIYWTLDSTNSNNFAVDSGNFTITNNTAVFNITPTNVYDAYPESLSNSDTFTIILSRQFGTQDNLIRETVATYGVIITPASTTNTTGFGWNNNALWGTDPISEGVVGSGTPDEVSGSVPTNVFVITETNPANTVIVTSDPIIISADSNTGSTLAIYGDPNSGWPGSPYNQITTNTQGSLNVVTTYPIGTVFYWYLSTAYTGLDARSHNFDEISGYITIVAPTAAITAAYGSGYNYAYITLKCTTTSDESVLYGSIGSLYQAYPASYNSTSTEKYWSLKLKAGNPSGPTITGSNYNITMTGMTNGLSNTTKLRWSGIWGSPDVVEGTTYTYRINGNGTPVAASWQIVHITTEASDFSAVSGTFTTPVGQYGQSTFTVTPIIDNRRETYKQFRIQVTDAYGATITSPVITIAPTTDITAPAFLTPTTINEGTAFNCTVYTVGLADGLYYWRINKPVTTGIGIADYNIGPPVTGDFSTYYGRVTISGNTGSFTVPALPFDNYFEPTETFTISLVTKTTLIRNWSINPISPATTADFPVTGLSGTTTPGGFNWSYFTVNAKADSLTEGTEKFTISIKDSSNNVLCTSGQISILDVSQSTPIAPYFTGASEVIEGASNTYTYTVYTTGLTDGTYYWRTNDVTTSTIINQNNSGSNEFLAQYGTIAITNNTGTFSITPNADGTLEYDEQFTISIVSNMSASNYRYWSINPVAPATTADFPVASLSGVCTPGGYNWWYFVVNATADSLTEGTEKFTISIRETGATGNIKFISGQISIADVSLSTLVVPYISGPTTVVEGITNTYTAYTTGLTDGTYYWRINDINTSTTPSILTSSTGDFTTSWGTVSIINNTGTFSITPYADSTFEHDEQFTVSLVNKAAADKYWTINHITTDPNGSDFQYTYGACIPGGYNWWYFNIKALADSLTEGIEKFNVQIRQGSTTGTVLTTSGAISITDSSLGGTYAVLPAYTIEAINFNVTIFTPNVTPGTTLYWDINHITTTDQDFVTTFGSFIASATGGVITISTYNYDAAELDERFTINVRTQQKYIWEVELIRSGTSVTVPEVYIFAQPDAAQLSITETMGLKVMRDDGTPSFDSRLAPLVITGAVSAIPPAIAAPNWVGGYAGDDVQYRAETSCSLNVGPSAAPTNFNSYNIGNMPAKPIFFYPSIAQSEKEAVWNGSWTYVYGYLNVNKTYTERYAYYFAFYRSAISQSGTYVNAGWVTADHGCYYITSESGAGLTTGSGGYSNGIWPYSNQTLNLQSGVCLISDGALYD